MRKLMHQKKGEVLDNIHSRTSVPSSMRIFIRQRIRWARGLVQTLYLHREVLLIKIWQNRFAYFFLITYFMNLPFPS
jgi:cellulose synthase/poly-beta-1,6-N-acetylglucosamine synthase-like glycosyltransferase